MCGKPRKHDLSFTPQTCKWFYKLQDSTVGLENLINGVFEKHLDLGNTAPLQLRPEGNYLQNFHF